MNKKSSYQKLKEANKKLTEDLLILADDKHERHNDVKHEWSFRKQSNDLLMYSMNRNRTGAGLIDMIMQGKSSFDVTVEKGKPLHDMSVFKGSDD